MARRAAEELQLRHNRESHDGKGTTELNECVGRRAYTRTASNEMDIVPIGATTLNTQGLEVEPATGKLKEAATYLLQTLVPGKHNAPPDSEAANSPNTAPPAT